jgi:hypothetical protein
MTIKARIARYLAGTLAIFAISLLLIPVALFPFFNFMPYLQPWSFSWRVIAISIIWIGVIAPSFIFCTYKERQIIFNAAGERTRDRIGVILGMAFFTFLSAALSANTAGIVAKLIPGKHYSGKFLVISASKTGSKYQALHLELRALDSKRSHYLSLSKRSFNFIDVKVGNYIELSGKNTLIGVYVDGVLAR